MEVALRSYFGIRTVEYTFRPSTWITKEDSNYDIVGRTVLYEVLKYCSDLSFFFYSEVRVNS